MRCKMRSEDIVEDTQIPAWYEEFRYNYNAGTAHGFIIHGDIDGYIPEGASEKKFLISTLAKRWPIIVCFDLAHGIYFADETMRKDAIKLLPGGQQDEGDIEQALAGIGDPDSGPKDPFSTKKPL